MRGGLLSRLWGPNRFEARGTAPRGGLAGGGPRILFACSARPRCGTVVLEPSIGAGARECDGALVESWLASALVRYGVTLPNLGVGDDPRILVEMIVAAEQSGWDGCFLWDAPFVGHANPKVRVAHDAWQLLALAAVRTNRIVLGTMITPLPWRRPWLVARDAVTLDRLSGGRFVLGVGLGSPPGAQMSFAEELDRRTRAVMLDESLEILQTCWSGESFDYDGAHYAVRGAQCLPRPTAGTIPVWVVGAWNRNPDAWLIKKSMRRTLRWDGILPNLMGEAPGGTSDLDDISAMTAWIRRERHTPFEVVMEVGKSVDENTSVDVVRRWAEAGATWWLEPVWYSMYRHPGDPSVMQTRIESGPPTT